MKRFVFPLILWSCRAADAPAAPGAAAFVMPSPGGIALGPGHTALMQHQFHDAEGVLITGRRAAFRSTDSSVLRVTSDGRLTGVRAGEAEALAVLDGVTARTHVRVAPPADRTVDVFPADTHQRIKGWEGSAEIGEVECDSTAFARYKDELIRRTVNELGLTRLRLSARSSIEHPVDHWAAFRAGNLPYGRWRRTWMIAGNDNDDPFVRNPAGFQWSHFDFTVETVFVPFRVALAARGDRLYINLNFVDFWLGAGSKPFRHMQDPEEYAELIVAVFDHMRERWGFVPDGVELNLEPENSPHSATEMGRSVVAVAARLAAAGYTPDLIGPSTTHAANAVRWYDEMVRVKGAKGLVTELSYHKYGGLSRPSLQVILQRARRDGAVTAMLEHIGSGFDGLYQDLTLAEVSVWEQFTVAYCGRRAAPENPGVYYQVDQSNPYTPRINLTHEGRLLRQVFMYARPGAVRLGATSSDDGLQVLAFRNVDGGVVAVVRGRQASAFALRGLPAGRYGVNYSLRTGAFDVDLPDVQVNKGAPIALQLPGDAALTVYRKGP